MKKNVFDDGYVLEWVGSGVAQLVKHPSMPIAHIVKAKIQNHPFFTKRTFICWIIEPEVCDLNKLNGVLPHGWQDINYRRFEKYRDVVSWLKEG